MKKLNKLAAAIAVVLSTGMASQAHAVISTHFDQEGDAMLFPVYYGLLENYYTVFNNSNTWTQVHVRFRGAAWSVELLDFEVILSPGDQFVMRVADVDGDGNWELDQSVDPKNYFYTGLDQGPSGTCSSNAPDATTGGAGSVNKCTDFSTQLLPALTDAERAANPLRFTKLKALEDSSGVMGKRTLEQRGGDPRTAYGYIEVIGEAVLNGCNLTFQGKADQFCDYNANGSSDFPLRAEIWDQKNPEEAPVAGFNADDAAVYFAGNNNRHDLDGVGNWLSGRFYVAVQGTSGISGNALVFRNFRTDSGAGTHRLDNYIVDSEVILDNGPASIEDGLYVYRFNDINPTAARPTFERGVSFNNTWGPTLADGDDYGLMATEVLNYTVLDATAPRATSSTTSKPEINVGVDPLNLQLAADNILDMNAFRAGTTAGNDFWDDHYGAGFVNSIAEVELALDRNAQTYTSQFFDGKTNDMSGAGGSGPLMSMYFAHFPTKFFRGEYALLKLKDPNSFDEYMKQAAEDLLSLYNKSYNVEVWDINENTSCGPIINRNTSPATVIQRECAIHLPYELELFNIGTLKGVQDSAAAAYDQGQVVLSPIHSDLTAVLDDVTFLKSFPGVLYTFNFSVDSTIELDHWVPMFRSEWMIAR